MNWWSINTDQENNIQDNKTWPHCSSLVGLLTKDYDKTKKILGRVNMLILT